MYDGEEESSIRRKEEEGKVDSPWRLHLGTAWRPIAGNRRLLGDVKVGSKSQAQREQANRGDSAKQEQINK